MCGHEYGADLKTAPPVEQGEQVDVEGRLRNRIDREASQAATRCRDQRERAEKAEAESEALRQRVRLLEQREKGLREASEHLLHLLTYDQDPRNYNAEWFGAINALGEALATTTQASGEESD